MRRPAYRVGARDVLSAPEQREGKSAPDLEHPGEINPFLSADEERLPHVVLPGYACKWMRVKLGDDYDGKNVHNNLHGRLRYEYVRPDEVPHLASLQVDHARFGCVIQIDDVVLVKTTQQLADWYDEANQVKAQRQYAALRQDLATTFNHPHSRIYVAEKEERGFGLVLDE